MYLYIYIYTHTNVYTLKTLSDENRMDRVYFKFIQFINAFGVWIMGEVSRMDPSDLLLTASFL